MKLMVRKRTILFKLKPNDEFILKAENNRMFKLAMDSIIEVLCKERKFYKKIKKWKEGKEIKCHLKRIGIENE